MDGFTKSLDELLHFAESLKIREKELEQQHQFEINKLTKDYEFQLQIEKGRNEQLNEHNQRLTEEVERSTKKQVDLEQKNAVLDTKHKIAVEELRQMRDHYKQATARVEERDKIVRMLTDDKKKSDTQYEQLTNEKRLLDEKLQEMLIAQVQQPPTTIGTPQLPEDIRIKIEKAIEENKELTATVAERNNEIRQLKEQLNKSTTEDPQMIEQRCLQLIKKLKADFSAMYENQSKFFLEKIDLLKKEQRDNIAKILEH